MEAVLSFVSGAFLVLLSVALALPGLGLLYAWYLRARRAQHPPLPDFSRRQPMEARPWAALDEHRLLLSPAGVAFDIMAWDDLREVRIESDERPGYVRMAQLWCFADGTRQSRIDITATGMAEVIAHLAGLAGFDPQAVQRAAREPGNHLAWRRPD